MKQSYKEEASNFYQNDSSSEFFDEDIMISREGYIKRMKLADIFEKRIIDLQKKLEEYDCEETQESNYRQFVQENSLKGSEFYETRRTKFSNFDGRSRMTNKSSAGGQKVQFKKVLKILESLVQRYERMNSSRSASEVGLREYKLKMRRNPGFYVNIFGSLDKINFMNLAVVLYEMVEEGVYDGAYDTVIKEIDKEPEKIFKLENEILDKSEEIGRLKKLLKKKEELLVEIMEQKMCMASWVRSCILELSQIFNSTVSGENMDENLKDTFTKIFEFSEILAKFNKQNSQNLNECDEMLDSFKNSKKQMGDKMKEIEKFCGGVETMRGDIKGLLELFYDKKESREERSKILSEMEKNLRDEREKNEIKSKRLEAILATCDNLEEKLKLEQEQFNMLRTENEVHKEKIDYLEGEIAKKSNTNFEILLENVISILKEEDVHQSIFDTDNDTLKTLYELALSKTLEIKERKKNFLMADAIRTEEILSNLEGQLKLTKALKKLGSLPASVSLIRDGLLAKRQILQDSIQENKDHLKHLKQMNNKENDFLKDYLKQRNKRALQLQKDKEILEAELESMKMCLETTNLENETLRMKADNKSYHKLDVSRKKSRDGSKYNSHILERRSNHTNNHSRFEEETQPEVFQLGLEKSDFLGMILLQSKMLEHQYQLLN